MCSANIAAVAVAVYPSRDWCLEHPKPNAASVSHVTAQADSMVRVNLHGLGIQYRRPTVTDNMLQMAPQDGQDAVVDNCCKQRVAALHYIQVSSACNYIRSVPYHMPISTTRYIT